MKNDIEILVGLAVLKLWIRTVKILFECIPKERKYLKKIMLFFEIL